VDLSCDKIRYASLCLARPFNSTRAPTVLIYGPGGFRIWKLAERSKSRGMI